MSKHELLKHWPTPVLVRDVASFDSTPCYALDVVHCGPYKSGPGEINVPVACAGLAVLPGDLIVGDADGVVAVPAAEAAEVLRRSQAHLAREAVIRETNRSGTADPERFDAVLRAKGLPV